MVHIYLLTDFKIYLTDRESGLGHFRCRDDILVKTISFCGKAKIIYAA